MRSRVPLILAVKRSEIRRSLAEVSSSTMDVLASLILKSYLSETYVVSLELVSERMPLSEALYERSSDDLMEGWYSLMTSEVLSICNNNAERRSLRLLPEPLMVEPAIAIMTNSTMPIKIIQKILDDKSLFVRLDVTGRAAAEISLRYSFLSICYNYIICKTRRRK